MADCRLLQGEVEHLLKQGYLTELFSEKGKQAYLKNRQEPPKPPLPKRTVNVISGGEKINGVTYTATKKVLEEDSITFDDTDADGVLSAHNDALMQANDKLIPKARILSGFDNSSIVIKGETILTTFAERVVKDTKFQVVEIDMAYDMILVRPWIHEMDAVPSTLHQQSQNSVEDAATRASTEDKQTDVDSRPDTIQESEENENIKTTIKELEAVYYLYIGWTKKSTLA
uniref:Uncharacterized protein n=1 Tax=Nicotiana tabacum TaxID=4097 RepID=A0A1S4DCI3_TOBAC|nr:PREDICTED: uncharacterized protein LOC107828374 [Nicotiana tabacum]